MLIHCFGKWLPDTWCPKLKIRCFLLVDIPSLVLLEKAHMLTKDQCVWASQHVSLVVASSDLLALWVSISLVLMYKNASDPGAESISCLNCPNDNFSFSLLRTSSSTLWTDGEQNLLSMCQINLVLKSLMANREHSKCREGVDLGGRIWANLKVFYPVFGFDSWSVGCFILPPWLFPDCYYT